MNNNSIFSYIESSNTDKIIAYIQNPNNEIWNDHESGDTTGKDNNLMSSSA